MVDRLTVRDVRTAVVRSLPLTLVTLAVMLSAVVFRDDATLLPRPVLLLFTLLAWLPLLVRALWPLRVLVVTVAVEAVQLATMPWLIPDWQAVNDFAAFQPVPVATVTAAFTVALYRPRRLAWTAGAACAIVLPVVALVVVGGQAHRYAFAILVMANLILVGTAVGDAIASRRERNAQEEAELAERTRRAVDDERIRIARDLHDVVAHHLTLVDAQVSVAGYLVRQDPAAAATALDGLARHTRLALDELRATVGLLRGGAEDESATRPPTPGAEQIPRLVTDVRAAGTEVELVERGDRGQLTPRADVAAYRIVQEALTNATKHAPDAPVLVELEWTSDQLLLLVTNPAPLTVSPRATGTGAGLVGMDERAAAAGGSVEHHHTPGGAFCVRATLPAVPAPTEETS